MVPPLSCDTLTHIACRGDPVCFRTAVPSHILLCGVTVPAVCDVTHILGADAVTELKLHIFFMCMSHGLADLYHLRRRLKVPILAVDLAMKWFRGHGAVSVSHYKRLFRHSPSVGAGYVAGFQASLCGSGRIQSHFVQPLVLRHWSSPTQHTVSGIGPDPFF